MSQSQASTFELDTGVYQDLRRMAAGYMRREKRNGLLQTTVVLHEAFLRLQGSNNGWPDRQSFCAAASVTMRRILIDYARKNLASKRGGGAVQSNSSDTRLAVDDKGYEGH